MKARPKILPAFAVALALAACHEAASPTESDAPPGQTARASLTGIVRDATGTPIGGPLVVCQGKRANAATAGAPAGSYAFDGLEAMRSNVEVYQGGVRMPSVFSVDLRPGPNVADLGIERFRGEPASISGVVRTTSGAPISGMKVSCQGRSSDVGADGSYALDGIVSGWWDVELTWGTYGEYGETFDLTPGANSRDFNVAY
jgi:hypothetical protein